LDDHQDGDYRDLCPILDRMALLCMDVSQFRQAEVLINRSMSLFSSSPLSIQLQEWARLLLSSLAAHAPKGPFEKDANGMLKLDLTTFMVEWAERWRESVRSVFSKSVIYVCAASEGGEGEERGEGKSADIVGHSEGHERTKPSGSVSAKKGTHKVRAPHLTLADLDTLRGISNALEMSALLRRESGNVMDIDEVYQEVLCYRKVIVLARVLRQEDEKEHASDDYVAMEEDVKRYERSLTHLMMTLRTLDRLGDAIGLTEDAIHLSLMLGSDDRRTRMRRGGGGGREGKSKDIVLGGLTVPQQYHHGICSAPLYSLSTLLLGKHRKEEAERCLVEVRKVTGGVYHH